MFMTFDEMETRFGGVAYEYLREIEKAARIAPNPLLDPEIRLANAFQAQDAALERWAAWGHRRICSKSYAKGFRGIQRWEFVAV